MKKKLTGYMYVQKILKMALYFFSQIHMCKNWLGGKALILTLQILISDFVQNSNASQTS